MAAVGAATLLLAGCSALTQHDIKRILAYSTVSQIGYMFLALGVGAWSAAIFHFVTHAFFKALLFLGAGVVIDALQGEHNIFRMGGLRKELPVTFWTFSSGVLTRRPALHHGRVLQQRSSSSGERGRAQGHPGFWIVGMVGALLTSLYTFRVIFRVFFGPIQTLVGMRPGYAMTMPLVILAFCAIVGGAMKDPLLAFVQSTLPVMVEVMPPV